MRAPTDPVGLSWLVTVRWTTFVAGAGAVVAGRSALDASVPLPGAAGLLAIFAASNLWLTWRVRAGRTRAVVRAAGILVCADVLLLTWLLLRSGAVLNPASVFYLVEIVVAALVLGRTWTWIVTALSVAGYATLFLTPPSALDAAQVMHPEISIHMRGMWLAFAFTALIIGVLVTRLAIAVERRDQALDLLRDRNARAARFAGLTTLATGAAHELSTPLATIAVAARELERSLEHRPLEGAVHQDVQLIRNEIDRCRGILDDMAGRHGELMGEAPRPSSLAEVIGLVRARLNADDQHRVEVRVADDVSVVWPVEVVARAVGNLVQNGLQASTAPDGVRLEAGPIADDRIRISAIDNGAGMAPEDLARAGEPFFTTKPPGRGTGLGLFVTRSSLEQLGGTLSLSSLPGRGTTATAVLPANVIAESRRDA
jgi:two-component system, sensor histidine kinase RegB